MLPIDSAKFRSTNAAWNNLMLNDPWSVGYVTTLIELSPFIKKEHWEESYYSSGMERERLVGSLNLKVQECLNDEQLVRNSKSQVVEMGYDLKNLNTQFGRTKERLYKKGEILYGNVKDNGFGLTIDECFECVRFRVICETWNGVIIRERNTIQALQKVLPELEFRKVPGEIDHRYAVDYEVYKNNILSSAIQIKPESYTRNAPYIAKAKNANKQKNTEYYDKFKVTVFDIISDSRGNVSNKEILRHL